MWLKLELVLHTDFVQAPGSINLFPEGEAFSFSPVISDIRRRVTLAGSVGCAVQLGRMTQGGSLGISMSSSVKWSNNSTCFIELLLGK